MMTCFALLRPARLASLALLTAVSLIMVVSQGAQSAGPYNVGNSAVRIDIEQKGPCQPGALESGNSIDASASPNSATPIQLRFTAPLNETPGFRGCIAPRNGPQYLVIDNELFQYANVHTMTMSPVDATTQSFNLLVENCFGFAPSDMIYVGVERMQWDTGFCDGPGGGQDYLHIVARPDTNDYAHSPGTFLRVHGFLLIVGRGGLPKFLDWNASPPGIKVPPLSDSVAYTPATSHGPGAPAHSPSTYARCTDYLIQTAHGGDDNLTARTRCALIYEPGYNPALCDSTPSACYWPEGPIEQRMPVFPLQASWNVGDAQPPPEYDELNGFIDDDGAGYIGFTDVRISATGNCLPYFSMSSTEHVHLASDMQIPTGAKNFTTGSNGTGTLYTRYYVVGSGSADPCGGSAALTLPSTFSFTRLSDTYDTDEDGCPDLKEMSGTISGGQVSGQGMGGWRDPLNHFDYMNPTGDGLNRVDDILAVVNQYFDDDADSTPGFTPFTAGYSQDTDRTALQPMDWNLSKPNGLQRVDDILASVKQYFHDCS